MYQRQLYNTEGYVSKSYLINKQNRVHTSYLIHNEDMSWAAFAMTSKRCWQFQQKNCPLVDVAHILPSVDTDLWRHVVSQGYN